LSAERVDQYHMKIGIIAGSGLYDWEDLKDRTWADVTTPWGSPSDQMLTGTVEGKTICFLPRHGRGHRILPSEINHRANIFALKQSGVDCIIGVSAVGSLHTSIRPRDMLLPDQYFDRTRSAPHHTFFGNGIAAHVSLGDPICPALHRLLGESAIQAQTAHVAFRNRVIHHKGVYVNMEGPAFSTRAESEFYRRQGFDVIGMTSMPEARLAREAELPYAVLALVTDYDCWHQEEGEVTADLVASHVAANKVFAQAILRHLIADWKPGFASPARNALAAAVMTDKQYISDEIRLRIPWLA